MNSQLLDLLDKAATAVGAVALVFIGSWENSRRTQKVEARKDAAAERAALEAQANELMAALIALKVAGNTHDHLWGGWRARARVGLRALTQGGAAALLSGRKGAAALPVLLDKAGHVVDRWDRDSALSAAGLAAHLTRFGTAAAPFLRREEPELAAAANALVTTVVESYSDDDRVAQALEDFHAALRPVLEPPAPASRWRILRRRQRALSER